MGAQEQLKRQKPESIETAVLQERLNKIYKALKPAWLPHNETSRFDVLWDVKELAIMEKRSSVEIPGAWLDDLERACDTLDRR